MSRGPDSATLLHRAVARNAAAHGCAIAIADSGTTRWASATFAGARHRITLGADAGAALDRWLKALPEVDLPLPRHLVADVVVTAVSRHDGAATVEIEALTVEL